MLLPLLPSPEEPCLLPEDGDENEEVVEEEDEDECELFFANNVSCVWYINTITDESVNAARNIVNRILFARILIIIPVVLFIAKLC